MTIAQILPLSFVMIAGPQIVSAFFLATSKRWGTNSLAYVSGAAISVTTFVTIAYVITKGTKSAAGAQHAGTVDTVVDWVILALLAFLIVRVFLTRKQSHPPKWMGKLQVAEPKFAFGLGLLLLGIFPTDILTSVTVGLHVGHREEAWWQVLPFVGMTLLFLGLPSIMVVLLGRRANELLPKIRDWMNNDAWVISEIVLVFFAALTINSLVGV